MATPIRLRSLMVSLDSSRKWGDKLSGWRGRFRDLSCSKHGLNAYGPITGPHFSRLFFLRVASSPVFLYLEHMEVHFSPEVETRLQQLAVANGKDVEQLVKDTVNRVLENQARFIAGVQRGIEQADRGELVEHSEVRSRIDRLFHS